MEISLSASDGFTRPFQRTTSGGTKPQVYYPTPPRPRSHSAGSSFMRQTVKYPQKYFPKEKQEEGVRNTNRYKTELCRPFQEYGFCKYSEKCQFAHGEHDLREVPRHPKYKTELCRTFHARGFCPYGARCHFIHSLDEARKATECTTRPKSPRKSTGFCGPTIGFTLPISPSVDSGISSPATEDMLGLMEARTFEFPPSLDNLSEEDLEQQTLYLLARNSYSPLRSSGGDFNFGQSTLPPGQFDSSDPFFDFDAVSSGSGSPIKTPSDGFGSFSDHNIDLNDLFVGMRLQDTLPPAGSPPNSRGRLPIFDDIIHSKSETALQQVA